MLSMLARWFVRATSPVVHRIALAYGLRVDYHCRPLGQHPLIIEDGPELARRNIPRTVIFNTRSGAIRIGANTVFGEEVMLLTGKHLDVEEAALTGAPLHDVPPSGRPITIGRGCYVGSRAIVVGPATIGDEAVIGAGAVVTGNVPARTFVAGVPARVVRTFEAPPSAESKTA